MSAAFVWYDLMTSDKAGAVAFYSAVVGWTTEDAPTTGVPGQTYTLFKTGERQVCGTMQLTEEMKAHGARPTWIGHVAVADVDATVEQAVGLGGAERYPATDIPNIGRFAMIADPDGAAVNVFTPKAGMPPMPEPPMGAPGYPSWRELLAGSLDKAFGFYSALFGWTKLDAFDIGPMGIYQLFGPAGGPAIGGMFNMPAQIPAPYWMYYFSVASIGAAAERVKAGGGAILMGPQQVPSGNWILQCRDPQGALFGLSAENA